MKELFVPYFTALKLKKNGFNETCLGFYSTSANAGDYNFNQFWWAYIISADQDGQKQNIVDNWQLSNANSCLAPLYQQVVEWLREKHNIHVNVWCDSEVNFVPKKYYPVIDYSLIDSLNEHLHPKKAHINYHDALNEGIELALKII